MGGSQSQERELSVEETVSTDGTPQILVTEDFLKYLKNKNSSIGGGTDGAEDSQREASLNDGDVDDVPSIDAETVTAPLRRGGGVSPEADRWKRKYEIEKEKNETLKKVTSDEFNDTVAGIKEKLSNRIPELLPLCDDFKEKVVNCYSDNPERPLNCSKLVKEYIQCVQDMQRDRQQQQQAQTVAQ